MNQNPSSNELDETICWQTFTLPSTCDGENIVCRLAEPKGTLRGVVQISHGMSEHIGRYLPFFRFLANEGFVVCGNDHLGHGKSCPDNSRLGFFAPEKGYQYLIEDLHLVSLELKKRYPDLPFFLFGHSMGSMIVRLYLSKYSSLLNGVVICGTAGPNPASKAGMLLYRQVIASKGMMYRSQKLKQLIFGSYNNRFHHPKSDCAWLSRDEQMVEAYENDPLCNFPFTASAYLDLLSLQYYSNTHLWYRTLDPKLPMLLISGSMDPVGNYGKGVTAVEKQLRRAGIQDLTMWLYPEARHELLNETNRDEVMRDVLSWFALHL